MDGGRSKRRRWIIDYDLKSNIQMLASLFSNTTCATKPCFFLPAQQNLAFFCPPHPNGFGFPARTGNIFKTLLIFWPRRFTAPYKHQASR
jgi:hypothetical protein